MIRIGIGKNLRITYGAVAPAWGNELDDYIAGLTTPLSAGQLLLLNAYILTLKAGLGITLLSEAFDIMYILAGETQESSLRNLISNNYHATPYHSPAFVQYEGFTGDGANDYIDTNFVPSTHAVRFTYNDCSHGLYSRVERGAASVAATYGTYDGTNDSYITLQRRVTITTDKLRVMGMGVTYDARQNFAASIGMIIGCQTAGSLASYRNKINIANDVGTSGARSAKSIVLLATRGGIAPYNAVQFDSADICFYFAGKYFTSPQVTIITDAFEAYMDAHGKGVIT
jgi:hypothetical protein